MSCVKQKKGNVVWASHIGPIERKGKTSVQAFNILPFTAVTLAGECRVPLFLGSKTLPRSSYSVKSPGPDSFLTVNNHWISPLVGWRLERRGHTVLYSPAWWQNFQSVAMRLLPWVVCQFLWLIMEPGKSPDTKEKGLENGIKINSKGEVGQTWGKVLQNPGCCFCE